MTQTPPPLLDEAWPWIIRLVGLGIIVYETVVEHADRPSLLVLAAGMIGLPEFVRLDRKRRDRNGRNDDR